MTLLTQGRPGNKRPGPYRITIFGTDAEIHAFTKQLNEYPLLFKDTGRVVKLPEERWIKIPLVLG